jgi:hypothetical protein
VTTVVHIYHTITYCPEFGKAVYAQRISRIPEWELRVSNFSVKGVVHWLDPVSHLVLKVIVNSIKGESNLKQCLGQPKFPAELLDEYKRYNK